MQVSERGISQHATVQHPRAASSARDGEESVRDRRDAQSRQVLSPHPPDSGRDESIRPIDRTLRASRVEIQASACDPVTTETFGSRWLAVLREDNQWRPQYAD